MSSSLGGFLVKNHLHLVMVKRSLVEQIGDRVSSLRRRKIPKMTTEDLAEHADLSRQTISAIENGKQRRVSVESIHKIAKALGVSMMDLLPDTPDLADMAAESSAEYKTSTAAPVDLDVRLQTLKEKMRDKLDALSESMPELAQKRQRRRRKKVA